MSIGQFIQEQVLGMAWLRGGVEALLGALGLDVGSKLGAAISFFFYDVIKIMLLLSVLIFVISYIQSYFPPERTRAILGRYKGLTARLLAALLGTVTPFCSCSSIPLFMGFTAAGLPLGVTFSFLISSPLVDLGAFVLLTGAFGAKAALAYVVLGLILAVAGGGLIGKLGKQEDVADFVRQAALAPAQPRDMKISQRISFAAAQVGGTAGKVWPYVLVGVGLGAVIHNYIPAHWIESLLGGKNPLAVPLATLVGVPMYADIFGTIPVAQALLEKGAALGTILSFMMAVTALSLPSLIMLRRVVSRRLLLIFTGVVTVGILLIGLCFNVLAPIW